jgi:hypothetical protein
VLKLLEDDKCFVAGLYGHKEVVVKRRGDDIAAYVGLSQRGGDCGSEAHSLEIGVHSERDPCRTKQDRKPGLSGPLFLDDEREAFCFPKRGNRFK